MGKIIWLTEIPKKIRKKLLKKINKQYNVNIESIFINEVSISILAQYRQFEKISNKQIKALQNMSNGISGYKNGDYISNHNSNRGQSHNDHSWEQDEGYWDDLGSMGYLN